MLHCNGNKLAGPSFPNKSLPIAISMIAANNRSPFQSQEVGFSQPSCLSFRVSRDVDYLLRRCRDMLRTAPTQTKLTALTKIVMALLFLGVAFAQGGAVAQKSSHGKSEGC